MEITEENSALGKTSTICEKSWPAWLAQRMNKTLEMYPACNLSKDAKAAHLLEWKAILDEVGQEAFDRALSDHIRNSTFFPTVSELRERAGVTSNKRVQLEAEQAWQVVERDLSKRGRDAPRGLSDRIEYAICCVGGRRAIDHTFKDPDTTTEAFKKKDFMQAYANYSAAQTLGLHQLAAPVRKLVVAGAERLTRQLQTSAPSTAPRGRPIVKPVPSPLSAEQLELRRILLKEQIQQWERSRQTKPDNATKLS